MDDWVPVAFGMIARVTEDILRRHEREEHDGELCPHERANVVAFLSHRLGASMDLVLERRKEYDEEHKSKGH